MKSNIILQADILDIIFDNRNKNYGAYTLRKFYNNRLYKALAITFGLAMVVFAISILKVDNKLVENFIGTHEVTLTKPPAEVVKKIELPKPLKNISLSVAKPLVASQAYSNNIKITNNSVVPPITTLNDSVAISTVNVASNTHILTNVTPINEPIGKPTATTTLPEVVDKITPSLFAEVMPQYPGGMSALKKFLEKNLTNPEEVVDGQNIAVKIRFIVGYDGILKGFETVEDGGTAFNNEVIRVLKKMPQWLPGKTKGQNVSVYYTIPVKFVSVD